MSSANSSFLTSATSNSILVHELYSLQSPPHLPFHLRPKAVLGARPGGKITPPFTEEEKEVLRGKVPCSRSCAQLGDVGARRWSRVGLFHLTGQRLPFQE